MSAAHDVPGIGGTAQRSQGRSVPQLPEDLPKRAVFGALLALFAISIAVLGGIAFSGFVALASVAAAREWHRLVGGPLYWRAWIASSAAILAALACVYVAREIAWPLSLLGAGALLAAALGATRGTPLIWNSLGAFYIGVPACALVALRQHAVDAQWVVLGLFLIVWTADTGAMSIGKIVGGPKLVPSLSPNKTWAGLIGGLVLPALALAIYVALLHGNPYSAFAVGFALAGVAHAGDLFESWVKRRMGCKDSGGAIPGHGGVLDRLDSLLFAAPCAALLVLCFGTAHFLGAGS